MLLSGRCDRPNRRIARYRCRPCLRSSLERDRLDVGSGHCEVAALISWCQNALCRSRTSLDGLNSIGRGEAAREVWSWPCRCAGTGCLRWCSDAETDARTAPPLIVGWAAGIVLWHLDGRGGASPVADLTVRRRAGSPYPVIPRSMQMAAQSYRRNAWLG
jgi:hypothetical protein